MPHRNEITVTEKQWLLTRIAIANALGDLERLETAANKPGFTPKMLHLWCKRIRKRFTSLPYMEDEDG